MLELDQDTVKLRKMKRVHSMTTEICMKMGSKAFYFQNIKSEVKKTVLRVSF